MRQNSYASTSSGPSNATQASTDFQIIDEARLAEPRRCQHHKIQGAGRGCTQVTRVANGEVFRLKARGVELLACGALDRRKIDVCGAKTRDRLLQRGVELGSDLALLESQILIARAHGEPVGLTHRGRGDDLNGEKQIRHHAPDDRELLEVLLAKHRDVWLDDIKERRHDGCDTLEMSGPKFPAQDARQLRHLDARCTLGPM